MRLSPLRSCPSICTQNMYIFNKVIPLKKIFTPQSTTFSAVGVSTTLPQPLGGKWKGLQVKHAGKASPTKWFWRHMSFTYVSVLQLLRL